MKVLNPAFFLIIAVFLFIVCSVILLPDYRYQINSDGIAYISIAKLYLSGDWHLVVNGMRSPLYSLLLVPLLALGVEALLATKILGIGLGIIGILIFHHGLRLARIPIALHLIGLFVSVVVFLWMAVGVTSPDFLLSVILLGYFLMTWRTNQQTSTMSALGVGLLGGLAYLAKHYAFPFVLVHFTGHHLWRWCVYRHSQLDRRIVVHRFLAGMVGFLLLSGAWMLIMQQKYGPFVVSYGGAYNWAIMAPDHPGHPVEWQGLIPPPHEKAVSIWDDPFTLTMQPWHPLGSVANIIHFANVVRQFFSSLMEIMVHFSPFAHALFLVSLWLAITRRTVDPSWRKLGGQITLAVAIFCAGYLVTMTEERYFWPIQMVFFYAALRYTQILQAFFPRDRGTKVAIVLLLLSFAYFPIQNIFHHRGTGKNYHDQAITLASHVDLSQRRLAANKYWHENLFITYHLQGRFYGTSVPYKNARELSAAFVSNNIDYFLYWGRQTEPYDFLTQFPEVSDGSVPGLRVYDVRTLSSSAFSKDLP